MDYTPRTPDDIIAGDLTYTGVETDKEKGCTGGSTLYRELLIDEKQGK